MSGPTIRPLTDPDYDLAYTFCAQAPVLNLYFLGNLEALGVQSDICEFWGSFDDAGDLSGVLMRYMDGWNIADGLGCDYTGFGNIIDNHPAGAARLQDNPRFIDSFKPYLQHYHATANVSEQLCWLDPADLDPTSKSWPVRGATQADFDNLCRFYGDAEDMTRSPRGVQRPLQDTRVFVVEIENQIVSSVLTNAETRTHAMIGGVYTPPQYRGNGYAKTAMVALCQSLVTDVLQPVLYYQNPLAGHIYCSLGFKNLGVWRSVRLARDEPAGEPGTT